MDGYYPCFCISPSQWDVPLKKCHPLVHLMVQLNTFTNVYVFVFSHYIFVMYVSKQTRLAAEDQRWKRRLSRHSFAERIPTDSSKELLNCYRTGHALRAPGG